MDEIKKDDDAAAHAPKPKTEAGEAGAGQTEAPTKQDAKNCGAKDGDLSLPVDEMNSANDE